MTRDFKKQAEWKKENNVYIGIGLSKKHDADIIEYIDKKTEEGETKQGVIKRSLRYTMEAEGFSMSDDTKTEYIFQQAEERELMLADHTLEYKVKKEQ